MPLVIQKPRQSSMKPFTDLLLPIVIAVVLIDTTDGTKQLDFLKTWSKKSYVWTCSMCLWQRIFPSASGRTVFIWIRRR